MPSPIEINALRLISELFERPLSENEYIEGSDIKERIGMSPQDSNDAVDYLDSKGFIDRVNFLGTAPYHFGGVKINTHGKQFYYETKGLKPKKATSTRSKQAKVGGIKIFISHSSKDATIAKKLIDLLRMSLNLTDEDIRCTSVNGYRLKGGAETSTQLKAEVFSCELLIGLISSNSMNSHYTLFELGARWGAKKAMLPLIIDEKGAEVLKGPLQGINALDAHDAAQLLQFVSDAGGYINKMPSNPSAYHGHIQELIDSLAITQGKQEVIAENDNKQEVKAKHSVVEVDSYSGADKIIKENCEKEWPNDFHMQSYCITKQRDGIKTLRKGKPTDIPQNQFESIRQRAALEWPDDFHMQAYEEEKQFNALRKLREE
jgi:hypothetical protein